MATIMATISIQPPTSQPKQASLQVMNQSRNAVSQIPLSDQPLSQEREDPAEAMELDATEQHAKLWIKIEDIQLTGLFCLQLISSCLSKCL